MAYSILEFQQQPENSPMSSYIWDVSNPNTPDFELIPQSQLTSINFNLKDTSLVGAGQYNGQFAYFDMRKGSTPVEASPVEHSHRQACDHTCHVAQYGLEPATVPCQEHNA